MGRSIEVTTLGDLFVSAADQFGTNVLLEFPDSSTTYCDLSKAAHRRAAALLGTGVRPGSHVGILMANCVEFIECLMATQLIGAVAVPINARFKPQELAHVLDDAGVELLFTHDLISEYANFATLIHNAVSVKQPSQLETVVMIGSAEGFTKDESFLQGAGHVGQTTVAEYNQYVRVRDPAIMMYTSGTTAHPKGCPLNHEVLVRNGINWNRSRLSLAEGEVCWAPLPMFHTASILPLISCMSAGATLQSMTHVEPGAALKMMHGRANIAFPAFPTVALELINHPDFTETDLSPVRLVSTVAPAETLRQIQNAFPQAKQVAAYGLTEAGGMVASNKVDDPLEHRLSSSGKPLPGLRAKIVDPETLEELPAGEKGEILIKGYAVFDGYHRSPERNSEAFVDGWFRTGDLCVIDEHGNIEFHGRIKDMLKVGGENVAAIEIESVLAMHPDVKLAQVIGVPDDRLVEVACAYVEPTDGTSIDPDSLIAFCRDKIASFKVPRHVRVTSHWPMSTTKIQKYVLREWYDKENSGAAAPN